MLDERITATELVVRLALVGLAIGLPTAGQPRRASVERLCELCELCGSSVPSLTDRQLTVASDGCGAGGTGTGRATPCAKDWRTPVPSVVRSPGNAMRRMTKYAAVERITPAGTRTAAAGKSINSICLNAITTST